jgi:hypothetical protein
MVEIQVDKHFIVKVCRIIYAGSKRIGKIILCA